MPENSTNRGYPLPVAGDSFTPQAGVNALGVAVDADVQALADDVADASGINNGAIGPAKLDRAYAESGNHDVRIGIQAGLSIGDAYSQSVAIGDRAMRDVDGVSSVAIGYQSQMEASGSHATAVGHQTQRTASGVSSVAVGRSAQEYASGANSVAVGVAAQQQTSGPNSVAIGSRAQLMASGESRTSVGALAAGYNVLVVGGTSFDDFRAGARYILSGTNLTIDGVPQAAGSYDAVGGETAAADGDLFVNWQVNNDVTCATEIGPNATADHPGGIALGFNAFADTDRQVQIGTDVTYNGVEPPNALRVGVHDAILTTDTPTTGEVLRFDGSEWAADGAATAAQGALADSAVQPGDLSTVATTGAYGDLSGTPTLGTAAATDASAYATAAQGAKADAAAPLVNIGNLLPPNVATGTDTLGNTTGFRSAGGGVVISSSTEQAWQGTRSLRAQAVGTGVQLVSCSTAGTVEQSSGFLPVTPGEFLHAEFRIYTSDTTSLWSVRIYFYNSTGTLLSSQQSPATAGAASWQLLERDVAVPAGASLAMVTAYRTSGADGGVAYLDGFGCWRGAGGSWRPTGQDIDDAGTRVKPTDASVVQLWNRSTSAWVDAAASSSVVFGTTAGTATEGDDTRVVNAVQNTRQVATGSGLTGGGDLTADRTLAVDFTAVATAAQGALADSAVQVVGSPSVGDVIEWDGSQWVPAAASTGLLPRSATITGTSAIMAQSGTVAVVYSATFGGARIMLQAQNDYVDFEVLLDAGTYSLTLVHPSNVNAGIATLTLDGSAFATIDTYAAATSQSDFTTVTGLAVSGGRHTLRVAADTKNASSSGYYVLINAIHLVRTGA